MYQLLQLKRLMHGTSYRLILWRLPLLSHLQSSLYIDTFWNSQGVKFDYKQNFTRLHSSQFLSSRC